MDGKLAAVFGAGFAGMMRIRRKRPARVLPDATALIPMEAQTVKRVGGGAVADLRKIQPNPSANDFGKLVLLGQFPFQQIQNGFCGQFPVGIVFDRYPLGAV